MSLILIYIIIYNNMIIISVVLIIKNREKYIHYLNDIFTTIEEIYVDKYMFEYFIYENNSTDDTKNAIKNFYKSKNRNGKYFLENIDNNKTFYGGIDIKRGKYMSFLRNRLKSLHGNLQSNYTLIIDEGVVFTYNTIEKMINTFSEYTYTIGPSETNVKIIELPTISTIKLKHPSNPQDKSWSDTFDFTINGKMLEITRTDANSGWEQNLEIKLSPVSNMVALNLYDLCYTHFKESHFTNYHYYDSFAFISNKGIDYKLTNNTCLFKNCNRCITYRNAQIHLDESLLCSNNNIFNVISSFGGFFLIKTDIYNKINWGDTICEHHSFCEEIRNFGDILIDPRLMVITCCDYNVDYKQIQIQWLK
jgi:hypothetical protein